MAYNAEIHSASSYWEPWLSMWRTNSLLLVAPWDNALSAFAERAQLLPLRMVALGLNPEKLARAEPCKVSELVERCTACDSPEECEWDLRRDPADPTWQTYCPNAASLTALTRKKHGKRGTKAGHRGAVLGGRRGGR